MAPSSSKRPASSPSSVEEPARKRPSHTSTLTLLVGGSGDMLIVPFDRKILIDRSAPIETDFQLQGGEGNKDAITPIPGADLELFKMYIDYIGTAEDKRSLTDSIYKVNDAVPARQEAHDLYIIDTFCRLWYLGSYLEDEAFKNDIIDNLLRHSLPKRRLISESTVQDILQLAKLGTSLRRWIFDHIVAVATCEDLLQMAGWMSQDDLVEIMMMIVSVTDGGRKRAELMPWMVGGQDRCKYHDHPHGGQWCG